MNLNTSLSEFHPFTKKRKMVIHFLWSSFFLMSTMTDKKPNISSDSLTCTAQSIAPHTLDTNKQTNKNATREQESSPFLSGVEEIYSCSIISVFTLHYNILYKSLTNFFSPLIYTVAFCCLLFLRCNFYYFSCRLFLVLFSYLLFSCLSFF